MTTWTDATGKTWNIKDMETSHLVNVAKTIWRWSMRRYGKDEEERLLYESQSNLLPGFDAVEEIEIDLMGYTESYYESFAPIIDELRNRHIRASYEGNGFLVLDDMRIQND